MHKGGGVHLYLSELAFINQFYSIMTRLVRLWLVQESFHNQFKIFWYGVSLEMRGILGPISFEVQGTDIWTDIWNDSIIWAAIGN